jgi:hypothetical protein
MSGITQRQMLKDSLAAGGIAAGHTTAGSQSLGRATGANDAIRVAVIGLHGRGQTHIAQVAAMQEHLHRNGVDLKQTPLTLGPQLAIDLHRAFCQ